MRTVEMNIFTAGMTVFCCTQQSSPEYGFLYLYVNSLSYWHASPKHDFVIWVMWLCSLINEARGWELTTVLTTVFTVWASTQWLLISWEWLRSSFFREVFLNKSSSSSQKSPSLSAWLEHKNGVIILIYHSPPPLLHF